MINRRGIIGGLISLFAAPAIVRAGSLMPVKAVSDLPPWPIDWGPVWSNIQVYPSFNEMVTEALRKHAREVVDNVSQQNAFWWRLAEEGRVENINGTGT